MIDLIQITNDPVLARRCDLLPGMRLFVDLEVHGKAERQAGRNTFISTHQFSDIARIKSQLTRASLMVRTNPLHRATAHEVEAIVAAGADMIMLPMFRSPEELHVFSRIVAGRIPIVALLETTEALDTLDRWIDLPGLTEVFVGLNDLHLSLGCRFMFEPLAQGLLDKVAASAKRHHVRWGFGGIARVNEGLLPGRDVLAEHLRLGSGAVILSRTFHRHSPLSVANDTDTFESEVGLLREAEKELLQRSPEQITLDQSRIASMIDAIAESMPTRCSQVTT